MSQKLALAVGALVLLVVSSAFQPAQARRGHHVQHHGFVRHHAFVPQHRFVHHRFHHRAHFVHRPFFHHRRVHRRVFVVVPIVYGANYYDNGCYWLRRRALYTGSSYWWNRYYACIYGY